MGIKYGDKGKDKKVKLKEMRGAKDEERDDPGWICRCITCRGYGYVELGGPVPDQCEECYQAGT